MRILIVDDSRASRRIISDVLSEDSGEFFEAGDGVEALEFLAKEGPVDVATVNWNMPNMDGLEFLRALRAEEKYKDVKVVMITTETERDKILEAGKAGADEFLVKPFTKEKLTEKLRHVGVTV